MRFLRGRDERLSRLLRATLKVMREGIVTGNKSVARRVILLLSSFKVCSVVSPIKEPDGTEGSKFLAKFKEVIIKLLNASDSMVVIEL